MSDLLVWIDCEMTGLDPQIDEICEIAIVVTNSQLEPLDNGLQLVIKPSERAMLNMGDFVTQMHSDSGLLAEMPSGMTVSEAENLAMEYLKQYVPEEKSAPLAGNSIGTDRVFLAKYMPALEKHLHYRNVDVSSLKELSRRWFPRVYFQLPKKEGNHRALADILESIQELRYYRKTILVPEPGPSSEEAKAVAETLGADRI